MLHRTLLDGHGWHMTADWLGMGKLRVTHRTSERYAESTRAEKSHFVEACSALADIGIPMTPNSVPAVKLFLTYAQAMVDRNALSSRTLFNSDPAEVARNIGADETR